MMALRRVQKVPIALANHELRGTRSIVSASKLHHPRHQQRGEKPQFKRSLPKQLNPAPSALLSSFHSSPFNAADSFHGLSLDDKVTHNKQNDSTKSNQGIQMAEVVKTEEDKRKTRKFIAELARAEILAHSSPKADIASDNGDAKNNVLSPYERQMMQLEKAIEQHSKISEDDAVSYAKSCEYIGELHYGMGHMEQSQEILLDGLQTLVSGDIVDTDKDEVHLVKAQIMHLLGAAMARCGEYDEASHWYEESLKLKHDLLNANSQSSQHHYEIGKTFNGLATLEVMNGGESVNWKKAEELFKDADSSYLRDYKQFTDSDSVHGWDAISKETVEQMSPHLAQLIINVRSNMGELFRQQKKHREAIEMLQLALDLARLDVSCMSAQNEDSIARESYKPDHLSNEPSPEERRNTVVDLLVKIADSHLASENYDEAAASYERALASHVSFRRLTGTESDSTSEKIITKDLNTRLPAFASSFVNIPLDIVNATTVEAAIRNNLAYALTHINQPKLALEQYETALTIKRHIGGNSHVEVGHTLMEMGALLGGPMNDVATALNCFKEALHIYRRQREDVIKDNSSRDNDTQQAFYDASLELDKINEHMHDAAKNIALIENALLGKAEADAGHS